MVILGIDPGIAIVGYGVVDYKAPNFRTISFGAVTTEAGVPVNKRIATIYDDVKTVIERYRPDAIAIEELFFNTNQKTAIQVAMARGAIILAAEHCRVRTYEYTPLQVKQSVVGFGRAEKKQVIAMVRSMLNLGTELKLDDTADALAIAICHAHTVGSRLSPYFNRR